MQKIVELFYILIIQRNPEKMFLLMEQLVGQYLFLLKGLVLG